MWKLEELHWRLSFPARLIIALGLFLLALSARFILLPIEAGLAYVTFYSVILLSLYICGSLLGVFVGIASGMAGAYYFIPPYGDFANHLFTASTFFFSLTLFVMTIVVYRIHRYTKYLQVMLDNEMIGSLRIRDRKIVWLNKAMTMMLGYTSRELIGSSTRILYPSDESFEKLEELAYPTIHKGESFRTQIQFRKKNGDLIWIDLSGSLLEDRINDSLWLIHDISELKRLENDLAQQARNDYLTGLPNRRFFMEQAAVELYRAN